MPIADTVLARVPAFRQLRAQHYAEHFPDFARAAWATVFPGRPLVWSFAADYLCEMLAAIKNRDPGFRHVIWNQPPRTGKSYFCSIVFPVWTWLSQPEHTFVFASYSMDLSIEHSIARRNLIQSVWFQRLFANRFQLSSDRNLTSQFSNDHRGQMFATSTGARLMGFGFDTCIADDMTSADMALSDSERTSANNWFDHTLRQRANDPSTSAILVISQRTHELDVPGFLLESEPGTWNHISIPLIAEEPREYVFPSGRVWKRPSGDVLQPKRFTPKVIAELQKRRLVYSGQYQQSPLSLSGNMIRVADLVYHSGLDPTTHEPDPQLPERFDYIVIAVDAAFRNYSDSDYTAIVVVGVKGNKRFIVNVINKHLDVGQMEQAIREQVRQWSARGSIRACVIESAASGIAISQRLRVNCAVPVIESPTAGGKIARFAAMSPEWQGHLWLLDRNASWLEFTRLQCLAFPKSKNDDVADALAHAAQYIAAQNVYGDEPLVAVLRHEIAPCAAAALAHVPSGYERGTAALGGWNVSPAVGRKMTDGRGLLDMTTEEIDQVLFGNLENLE